MTLYRLPVMLTTLYRTLRIRYLDAYFPCVAILCMYLTLGNTLGLCGAIRTTFFLLSVWSPRKKKKKPKGLKLACGRAQSPVCIVCVCIDAGFIALGWAWPHEPILCHWGEQRGRGDRWTCPEFGATFAPRQVPLGAWHEVKGEAMSVNEAPYAGAVERGVTMVRSGCGCDEAVLLRPHRK